VRKAEPDALIVADGFSCREQIEQETDRRGVHLAQVLEMAIHRRDGIPAPRRQRRTQVLAGVAAGAVTAGLVLALAARRSR
jgi:hypothetical protein